MEEQSTLKKQFILHILYNMIAFSIIFCLFGVIVFLEVKRVVFYSVDEQLIEAKNQLTQGSENANTIWDLLWGDGITNFFPNYSFWPKLENPQISLIFRDEEGKILNASELKIVGEYSAEIQFDKENLDNFYIFKLEDKYNYRAINFDVDYANNIKYVQLMINCDASINLLNKYFEIIVSSIIIGVIFSGMASFILSKKTLKPVQEILKKQTEFIQNASHELRTPLTIIQAKQELLLQDPNAKIIDKSEEIMLTLSETKRLTKLTKDLTVLVNGSSLKKSDLNIEDIYIDEFIEKITVPYIEIANSQGKEFNLKLNFGKDIGVDTSKIHQLIVILLDNAIKYTETGDKIQINSYYKDNKCIIEVCDTGIGISDDSLNRVFERFYRDDKARNRESGGSGLGLSIASVIVKSHNGTIKASHNQPKGSIFTIKLNR